MGYNTIQRKAFIKVDEDRFIPFVRTISSNCFDLNGAHAREDFSLSIAKTQAVTMDDVIAWVEETVHNKANSEYYISQGRTEKDIRDRFGYYTTFYVNSNRSMTDKQVVRFFKRGQTDSKTVEEWRELGGIIVMRKYGGERFIINTTDELLEKLEEYNNISKGYYVYVENLDRVFDNMRIENRLTRSRAKLSKTTHTQDHSYAIVKDGKHLNRLTKRGYNYFMEPTYSMKKFKTEREAQRYLDKHTQRLDGFEVVRTEVSI